MRNDETVPEIDPEIDPDTKDWTWVLERPCPECGFDAAAADPLGVGDAVRATLPRWSAVLTRQDVRTRPAPGVWSPLEYAAHVRDVFRVFDSRLAAMLAHDDPTFANWDQDAAAVEADYASQDPAEVTRGLAADGEAIAARFDAVGPQRLERPGRRSNGSRFTVRTLGQYFLHDVVHHLHDVGA
ncbi:DinB family protein [Xylanimonas ulmi]|uniref:DinB family protein n=1 Tax=Xylanimonas ulmi TaxID=228973 RepID=A0A4Q7M5T7_9MICO|nr:DinB family protein [Xylanibacterium ulmi]RZS62413.1 DinB family protein [Xylanibacterium ulmi]